MRQQSPAQGRWLVPDPAGLAAVDMTNPQIWNRYAYVGNNPLSNVDPFGLEDGSTTTCSNGHCRNVTNLDVTDTIIVTGWWNLAYEGWTGRGSFQSFFCMLMGGCSYSSGSSGGGGGGGQAQSPAQPQPKPSPVTSTKSNPFNASNQVQSCLSSFYNSKVGKGVNFFSLLSMIPGWGPDPGKSALEWIGGGTAKYFGLKTAVEGSTGTLITLNTSTVVATIPEKIVTGAGELILGVGEAAGPYAVGAASLTDLMAHYGCTVAAYPGSSIPSPF